MNVLMDLKDELLQGEEAEAGEATPATENRARRLAGTAIAFVRERKMVAALAGVGLLTLPVIAVAIMSNSNNSSGWVTQASATSTARRDSVARVAYATDPAGRGIVPPAARDSTAGAVAVQSGTPRARPSAHEDRASVPGTSFYEDPVGETLSIPLGSTLDNNTSRASVRARLLGSVPAPAYPDGLLRSGIGGEVRVRFDVDTAGRPIMSTFAVLLSPHAKLSDAVRKVVSTMRFEAARTPWPESKRVSDEVEMSFHFTPTTK